MYKIVTQNLVLKIDNPSEVADIVENLLFTGESDIRINEEKSRSSRTFRVSRR